jgi:hypothetical protein
MPEDEALRTKGEGERTSREKCAPGKPEPSQRGRMRSSALTVLGLLLGINLVVSGFTFLMLSSSRAAYQPRQADDDTLQSSSPGSDP